MKHRYLALVLSSCIGACGDSGEPAGPELRKSPTSPAPDAGEVATRADADAGVDASSESGAATDSGGAWQEPEQSGEATHYDAEGVGACGIQTPPDYLVAAINDEQYSKANCGRCVSVMGPSGTVVVRIIDKCPGCDAGDLDLSQTAFSKIAPLSAGRVKITWSFVDCPF